MLGEWLYPVVMDYERSQANTSGFGFIFVMLDFCKFFSGLTLAQPELYRSHCYVLVPRAV